IAPGENRTNFVGFSAPNYFPPIDHVDIPPGVLVQAFYRPDFKGSWRLLTESGTYTFVRSFRVYRTDDDVTPIGNDDEPVVAFLKYGRSDWTLCVPAGQNAASQIVFAMSMTRRGFDTIDVPVGLALVAYSGTHFHGQRRVIPSGVYTDEYATDVLNWMQSLRVVQASNVLAVQTETTSGPGVRGHFTSKACSNANMTFVLDQEYMVLPKLDWTTLYIPDGLALVAYDRPWLLGRYSVWTNSVVQSPRSLGAKFRSVKVVLASEAPPVQLDPLPPSITGGTFGKTYVGEEEPGVGPWELDWLPNFCSEFGGINGLYHWSLGWYQMDGLVVTFFDDYNFQGSSFVNEGNKSVFTLIDQIKSYKLHRAISSPTQLTYFVGLYPHTFGLDVPPVLMQDGDNISALIYPWNTDIKRVTVPKGLKLLTYAGERFQGHCKTWMEDAAVLKPWKTSILSLRVRATDDESTPCPAISDQSKIEARP
ncbi:hypothetical protein As57867_010669, partial [Aphanomyces stellatus]